jgi:pimeloyl-ACP methyl ester carboxylesterase
MWRARFTEDFREALRQGPGAAVADLAQSHGHPDVTELAHSGVDTVLVHGSDDVNVPIGIARWVAAEVPHARLIERRGEGHLSTLAHPELVLHWVAKEPGP